MSTYTPETLREEAKELAETWFDTDPTVVSMRAHADAWQARETELLKQIDTLDQMIVQMYDRGYGHGAYDTKADQEKP